jgi:mono/diheme cytochrome c family protein
MWVVSDPTGRSATTPRLLLNPVEGSGIEANSTCGRISCRSRMRRLFRAHRPGVVVPGTPSARRGGCRTGGPGSRPCPVFFAGSCGTCHATPGQADATRLGGGLALVSGFGTFYMPNISSDVQDGIGAWTTAEFTRAMREGVSRAGANEYPAFPYTSFQRMTANDLRDLFGYIKTLSPVAGKARDHDLAFPFTMRRGVGLWQLVFLDGEPLPAAPNKSKAWLRGRYLVEGAGHCAECHSPRNVAGAIEAGKRYSGAPDPEGQGYVPNITPAEPGSATGRYAGSPTISTTVYRRLA